MAGSSPAMTTAFGSEGQRARRGIGLVCGCGYNRRRL
jgi:hypothetical protein